MRVVNLLYEATARVRELSIEWTQAHVGLPWNELADSVAKWSSRNTYTAVPPEVVAALQYDVTWEWAWLAEAEPSVQAAYPALTQGGFQGGWTGGQWLPDQAIPGVAVPQDDLRTIARVGLSCASFNACTLLEAEPGLMYKRRNRKADIQRGPHLRAQFKVAGLHIVGIQESRFPPGKWVADDMLVVAGGGEKGNLGCAVIFSLSRPIAVHNEREVFLKPEQVLVLYADPRLLILRVTSPCFSETL